MISIGGIPLPESAVWANELKHGTPSKTVTPCTEGCSLVHSGGVHPEIEIYVPKIAGELTRQTVMSIKSLAQQSGRVSININGQVMEAVFTSEPFDLKPINAKQIQEDTDSYYGYIRLMEV